ncbi:hypothetical protein [Bradyrhizobium sp. CCH5-F6]|uniref:hypothetical protein n=1 Tax=Bradyrhizobium sp. CCH5-F6 TaxID=1768753 RepID=UPI000769B195|nr:hypothetical protein [Bradyrhizobium sp. CCH5-F6]
MTVAELIAELAKFDPSARVVIPGYELGFDDVAALKKIGAVLDSNVSPRDPSAKDRWYFGRHAAPDENQPFTEVVLIAPPDEREETSGTRLEKV